MQIISLAFLNKSQSQTKLRLKVSSRKKSLTAKKTPCALWNGQRRIAHTQSLRRILETSTGTSATLVTSKIIVVSAVSVSRNATKAMQQLIQKELTFSVIVVTQADASASRTKQEHPKTPLDKSQDFFLAETTVFPLENLRLIKVSPRDIILLRDLIIFWIELNHLVIDQQKECLVEINRQKAFPIQISRSS